MPPIVELDNVTKIYRMGHVEVPALRGISLTIQEGEYVAIMGPSGCGKSTLLNVLGCLDRPTHGHYRLRGQDVATFDDDALSEVRCRYIGFIFQSYNLLPQFTVVENIALPLFYAAVPEETSEAIARELAQRVGLGHRLNHKPTELSGGQQQRVGIARALANDPLFILADEPTGNLDSEAGKEILQLFEELHAAGKTLVLVTHDAGIAERAKRVIRLRDGNVEYDSAA